MRTILTTRNSPLQRSAFYGTSRTQPSGWPACIPPAFQPRSWGIAPAGISWRRITWAWRSRRRSTKPFRRAITTTEVFHSTGTCGTFGSTAACARLRGLDAKQTVYALGIGATEGGGFRDNFGSMTKPFQAGHAAENGTVAVELAALGWTAAEDILEAPLGFFQAEGGGFDPDAIMGRLGKPWTLASPGVSIKPHPSGSLSHPAMGEMLRLIHEHDIKAANVEKVDVGANHAMLTSLLHHHPTTGLQGKFSMEYCVKVASCCWIAKQAWLNFRTTLCSVPTCRR